MRDFTYAAGAALREADEVIEGERMADAFVSGCRACYPDPDELHYQIELARQGSLARLRGFARRLQKVALEVRHDA